MFAFALVDFRTRRVHLVRDRLGKKPLVYAHVDGALAFGSTVRSVLPWLPRDRRGFSPAAIDAYLAHRYVPAPRTILEHVGRLPNAHRAEYDLDAGTLAVRRYWSPAPAGRDGADARACLDRSIEARLVADRPLGCSCPAASIRGRSPAGWRRPGTRRCARSRRRSPARASTRSRRRAGDRGGARAAERAHRRADRRSAPISRASSPRWTSRSPIRRRSRPGTSPAARPARSRWCSAATAATSSSPATSGSPSTCAIGGAASRCRRRCCPTRGPRAGARRWPNCRSTGRARTRCASPA